MLWCVDFFLPQNATDIHKTINERREILQKVGSTLQPIPIFVGPKIKIEESFVLINDTLYHCNSPLNALELAFISFFVLHAEYPEEALQVWLFVQRLLFDIKVKGDKISSSLNTLLGRFDR